MIVNAVVNIYDRIYDCMAKSIRDITPYTDMGKTKATKLLKDLVNKGLVTIEGNGRGTKYRLR